MRKRDDGRYQKSFMQDGKRYYVYSTSKKDLDAKILEKKQELINKQNAREDPTFSDYCTRNIDAKRGTVKSATIRNNLTYLKKLKKVKLGEYVFGDLKLKDIRHSDIKTLQRILIDEGLSANYANNIIGYISMIYNSAICDDIVSKNPTAGINNIKDVRKPASETIHRALTVEETKQLFSKAQQINSFFYNAFAFQLQTGMRVGEVGALELSDFDFKEGFIYVNKTVSCDDNMHHFISSTAKTDKSTRRILMNEAIKKIVNDQQTLLRQYFGLQYSGRMFTSKQGSLYYESPADRELKIITDMIGIDRITTHSLRATFATRFLEQRPGDYKVLSEILGHSNVSITLNLYAHVMEESRQKAMKEIIIAM